MIFKPLLEFLLILLVLDILKKDGCGRGVLLIFEFIIFIDSFAVIKANSAYQHKFFSYYIAFQIILVFHMIYALKQTKRQFVTNNRNIHIHFAHAHLHAILNQHQQQQQNQQQNQQNQGLTDEELRLILKPQRFNDQKKQKLQNFITNNEIICSICDSELNNDEQFVQIVCTHIYHYNCLGQWLKIRPTCPLCRFDLREQKPETLIRQNQVESEENLQIQLHSPINIRDQREENFIVNIEEGISQSVNRNNDFNMPQTHASPHNQFLNQMLRIQSENQSQNQNIAIQNNQQDNRVYEINDVERNYRPEIEIAGDEVRDKNNLEINQNTQFDIMPSQEENEASNKYLNDLDDTNINCQIYEINDLEFQDSDQNQKK